MEVELQNGLRHQIRAQLACLGYPIRGDVFYGGKPAKRLYLHAQTYEIEFQDKAFIFCSNPHDFSSL
jgi:23S rRNA-/tRNA-specific pseudouridylate synthase